MGYSFGANLALALTSHQSKRFSGIVCIGASVYLHMTNIQLAYLRYLNRILRFIGKHTWRKPYVPKSKIDTWESTGNYAYIPLKSMLDWKNFIDNNTRSQIKKITTPILIMHSRGDRVSHPRSAEYIYEHVGSSYKELFMLPEYNHNPLRTETRTIIFSKILSFIES